MKLELFTLGRNSIMMRVENIGDIFNTQGVLNYQHVKIYDLAVGLFELMNESTIDKSFVEVTETSLTGNQSFNEMQSMKIRWQTEDDDEERFVELGQRSPTEVEL